MLLEALYQGVEFSGVPARNKKLIEALEHKNDSIIKSELADLEKAYKAFANKDYNRKVDQRVSKVMLKAYMKEVGKENRPEIFTLIDKNSTVTSTALLMKLLKLQFSEAMKISINS